MAGAFSSLFPFSRRRERAGRTAGPAARVVDAQATPLPELVLQAERIARALAAGAHGRRMAGAGEDFWQYRAAQPGEPASRIDWRQSARSDQLWVREREAESPQTIALWCDPSASMAWRSQPALPTKRDRAQVCTLALASALLRGGERVGMLGMGARNSARPGRFHTGQSAFPALAHVLTEAPAPGGDDWPETRALRPYAQILLVSDFLWPEERIAGVLDAISGRAGRAHLLCVLDPAELTLPYEGRVRFNALETGDSLTLPAVETLRTDYDAAIARHLDILRTHCAAHRADFTLHVTDQSPMPALLALHGRLSGARGPQ
ncbi:DUF58 domain-containing protein [Tanticharoenia sakaeratensis]|uniref:DUF58 domain-containing protein n=1 Tax=Tanticharoenia sakaeratensis NBRC 103193 TaxID=1231623 RepID=A0A0D6MJK3_9PROT|nr:DUF58 domain-containing protein [Tanticharoenia sakaeratensis]GAN53650.1 hypothetical protein Tasa_010_197 [Tanticharoenia sakaeratensis NBRC 103193]GBQ17275.1 hypothetical protein AA103193_0290 [Tanticharoenia sakaeratensis NBRC 103193]